MEALLSAYGSGDDDATAGSEEASKKRRLDGSQHSVPVPGRYVSKRERALLANADRVPPAAAAAASSPPALKSILSLEAPVYKRFEAAARSDSPNFVPSRLLVSLNGHKKSVNAIRWSPTHAYLLASAGMDSKSFVWNVWAENPEPVRNFELHKAAVKDVQWSSDGNCLLTCGFDSSCLLIDVEKGGATRKFDHDQFLNLVMFHPLDTHLFVSGDARGVVRLWDLRAASEGCVCKYVKDAGPILDLDFSKDGRHFVCTYDVAERNSSDKTIVVWDFHSQIALSNQVYLEAYTCPSVRYHPQDQCFVAQSNADYIAIFSARPPFKLNKFKRYQGGHQVSGFPVKCNFSPDGELLVSGSADGCLVFYSYRSSKLLKRLRGKHRNACVDACFHPRLPSVVASSGWDGTVCVFE